MTAVTHEAPETVETADEHPERPEGPGHSEAPSGHTLDEALWQAWTGPLRGS
ncbi:hypothetical protein V1L54_04250 [Streptomyces sp. TRM 70361]|uniref:hypothetical protein n=1 Tax=Streptomyces sp. TRM 70361 TaxID=3116553 RepID=UPI002E7BA7CE|nr:hypothetical protein [Streptomyces sp. TRM 70361]MEE1938628.1 hypothetical protein [Streptomyces sp. TRM 70361]